MPLERPKEIAKKKNKKQKTKPKTWVYIKMGAQKFIDPLVGKAKK